jgi:carbon monoxide dehydrogenase subunit G
MNLTADVWIDASSEVVWKQVVDPAFWTMIVPFLTQAELLGPPPLATGSKLRFTFDRAGRRLTSEAEVPELTPPRRMKLHHRVPQVQMDVHSTLDLVPEGTGTRVRQAAEIGFANPIMRAMGEGLLRAQDPETQLRAGLDRLKQAVEAGA